MKAELEKLIELQKTDSSIRLLKQKLETAEERRAELEMEFERHASSIREVQGRREGLNNERLDLDRQISENKVHLERAERNLKHSQNQREYETAMRDIDAIQKQIAAFETQIVDKMEALETVDKELEERADEINTLDAKRAEALGAFDKELEADRAELKRYSGGRDTVFKTLPAQLASVYDRLAQRSRDGIAVAEVVNGSCSACFMSLRPQMQVEVKKGQEIITCESCTRILFVAAKPETNEAAAS